MSGLSKANEEAHQRRQIGVNNHDYYLVIDNLKRDTTWQTLKDLAKLLVTHIGRVDVTMTSDPESVRGSIGLGTVEEAVRLFNFLTWHQVHGRRLVASLWDCTGVTASLIDTNDDALRRRVGCRLGTVRSPLLPSQSPRSLPNVSPRSEPGWFTDDSPKINQGPSLRSDSVMRLDTAFSSVSSDMSSPTSRSDTTTAATGSEEGFGWTPNRQTIRSANETRLERARRLNPEARPFNHSDPIIANGSRESQKS